MSWSLPLQLEDNHTSIVTSSKQVESRVTSHHPKPVMLPPESMQTGPLGHVPHSDGFVLAVGQDEFLSRVEDGAGHIVVVTTACVHLPGLIHDKQVFKYMINKYFFKYNKQQQLSPAPKVRKIPMNDEQEEFCF